MIQFETEDILPRPAPKPTIDFPIIENPPKPTVPEVSVLFSRLTSNELNNSDIPLQCESQKSYSSWKTRLPKVVCLTGWEGNGTTEFSNLPTKQKSSINVSNLYPSSAISPSTVPVKDSYQQCFDIASPSCHNLTVLKNHQSESSTPESYSQSGLKEVKLNSSTNCVKLEVQNVCSATQTDLEYFPLINTLKEIQKEFTNFPTKQDYQDLLGLIQTIRAEQQHLMNICSTLLEKHCGLDRQHSRKELNSGVSESVEDIVKEHHETNTVRLRRSSSAENVLEKSPKGDEICTKYRPTETLPKMAEQSKQQNSKELNISPHISITEQSIVMNELALKYLPQNKLNEMVHESRTSDTSQQGRVIEHYGYQQGTINSLGHGHIYNKELSDISNASYKYLKKYRLLLEEYVSPIHQQKQKNHPTETTNAPCLENMLDLNTIRNQQKYL